MAKGDTQGGNGMGGMIPGQQARFDPSGMMPGSQGGIGFMPGESGGMPNGQKPQMGSPYQRIMGGLGQIGQRSSMDLYGGGYGQQRPGMPQPQQQYPPAQQQPSMPQQQGGQQMGGINMNDPRLRKILESMQTGSQIQVQPQQPGGFNMPSY